MVNLLIEDADYELMAKALATRVIAGDEALSEVMKILHLDGYYDAYSTADLKYLCEEATVNNHIYCVQNETTLENVQGLAKAIKSRDKYKKAYGAVRALHHIPSKYIVNNKETPT